MDYRKQFQNLLNLALDLGLQIEKSDYTNAKGEEILSTYAYQRLSQFLISYKPVLEVDEEQFEEERYLNLV